jgi:hypothetical protein
MNKKQNATITNPEVSRAIQWVGNHDIKALAYIGLANEPKPVTKTELGSAVSSQAGIDVRSFVHTYPHTYMLGEFAVASIADRLHRGAPVTEYEAINEDIALAVVGELLEWSEKHNISLIDMLSSTASKGIGRAPKNSLDLFQILLDGDAIGNYTLDGYDVTDEGWQTAHNTRLKKLVDIGVVVSEDPIVETEILDPTYHGSRPFESLKKSTQSVYEILRIAKSIQPDGKWSIDDLMEIAALHKMFSSDSEKTELEYALTVAFSEASPRNFANTVRKIQIPRRKYAISPEYEDIVHDLLDRVHSVDTADSLQTHIDKAHDLYTTTSSIESIAERGRLASPFARKNKLLSKT